MKVWEDSRTKTDIEIDQGGMKMEITKEELKQIIDDAVKTQLEAIRKDNPGQEDPTIGQGKTDLATILGQMGVEFHVAGNLIYTDKGSIISNATPITPWVKLSPEMENYAQAIIMLIKSGGTRTDAVMKLLQENTDTAGGYLVPEEFEATVVQYDTAPTIVWPRATIWPMGTDKLGMPKLAQRSDKDAADFDHFAGVVFTWTEEGHTKTETEPSFEFLELIAHELSGYTAVTNILLEDSTLNIMNFLTGLFRRAWLWFTDRAFLRGQGARQPLGVISDPAVLVVNRAVAGTVTYADVLAMDTKLPAVFDQGAVWMCNKDVLNALRGQVDAAGQPVLQQFYHTGPGGIGMGQIDMMLGYPIVKADQKTMPLGTRGDIILGNWSWYYIGQRKGFSMDISTHFLFRANQTAIRVTGRLDGQAAIPEAFCVLDVVTAGS